MITSEQKEVLRVLDLVAKKKTDSLERLLTSVNVVAEEKIVCLRRKATVLEKSEQIVVLSMYVTAYLQWRLKLQ